MSGSLTPTMIGLILFCVFAETAMEVCFKKSADGGYLSLLVKPLIWLGIVFWAVELLAWTIVLEWVPLSIAFPLMASSYVIVVFAGAVIFREKVNLRHAAGVFLVAAGVACVGVTGL
ncbi:EamA family transporter [Rhizobium sp. BK251]|uniref:EamA family transporter n=1 Tax=Rhizobium sp. BK251 TaxID=2512125 RepID=UPI00104336FC|nr:EamA family transporter [Rhizobium sp. BK251]TCL71785.1 undecaprenyl phosphate-alpha-L-ara4N flippase subunit ArnE [Rhizobium sp. BK251]